LFILYLIISVLNLILFVPEFWSKSKDEIDFNAFRTIIHIFFFFLLPTFNIIAFIAFSVAKIRKLNDKKKSEKFSRENPKLASIKTLKDIRDLYITETSSIILESFQDILVFTEKQDSRLEDFVYVEKDLSALITELENEQRSPEISSILIKNEITLTRILTILKESEEINDKLTSELLVVSLDSLKLFLLEIQKIKEEQKTHKKEFENIVRSRLIDELQDEFQHQKNRAKVFN
jgi:large-conductance mechanosensitive channel